MPNTKINRSARTGKIVTAKKAKRNPRTTVTETVTGYQRNRRAVMDLLHSVALNGTKPMQEQARKLISKITGKPWSGYKKAQ